MRPGRGVARRAAAALLALACSSDPTTPEAVIETYFAGLVRDPARSFLLLAPSVHEASGLGPFARNWTKLDPIQQDPHAELVSAQEMWLNLWWNPWFREATQHLGHTVLEVHRDGLHARVRVRAELPGSPPLEQTFDLAADGDAAPWRIVAIEQSGVTPANQLTALVAGPTSWAFSAVIERHRHGVW